MRKKAFVDKMARFLRASIKGWKYAAANPDAAADIVLENDDTGAQTEKHQRRMMGEINKLVGNQPQGIGYLIPDRLQAHSQSTDGFGFYSSDHQKA